jgi:hemolysin activation/secretion protein
MRPGAQSGTGDLDMQMRRDALFSGDVGGDNYGNRYTGRLRAYADFALNSPFMFGDQVTLNTLYTKEHMWYGTAGYNAPIGGSGLRGSVGFTHTYYKLGEEFSDLDAHGTATIVSAGLSYPLLRSQKANMTLGALYQHKWLVDEQESNATKNNKDSDSIPLTLNFDLRDTLGGGGVTYGALSWTVGNLDLDHGLASTDATTAHSKGSFSKVNLDMARLQALPFGFTLYARAAGQWAADNLDSSEKFGLGGPSGVRAYPTGEGYGDTGAFGQIELRYKIDAFTPYAFYDGGWVKTNADPWTTGDNGRSIGGPGLGLRFERNGWHADGTIAWRSRGGDPKSDSDHDTPQIFVQIGYRF